MSTLARALQYSTPYLFLYIKQIARNLVKAQNSRQTRGSGRLSSSSRLLPSVFGGKSQHSE
jgi:hypothetical protein